MATLKLSARYAALVARFASEDATRFYYHGFSVERASVGAVLVATDGYVLGAFHDEGAVIEGDLSGGIVKTAGRPGREFMKALKAAAKHDGTLEVDTVSGRATVTGKYGVATVFADRFDADVAFPNWRRVIPDCFKSAAGRDAYKGAMPAFRPKHLALFDFDGEAVRVTPSPNNGPALVQVGSLPFFGFIMPKKSSSGDPEVPAWTVPPRDAAA